MDPVTIFFIATLMMLANGGVLGLMHKDLPLPMRPAAASWRIATLLFAGGSILFAAQGLNPLVTSYGAALLDRAKAAGPRRGRADQPPGANDQGLARGDPP